MDCKKPISLRPVWNDYQVFQVPCGKCKFCKIAKRREWKMRCLHELSYWRFSSFITLTYNNDNLPIPNLLLGQNPDVKGYEFGTLVKNDLQKFLKRLRKRLSSIDRNFKYFACGEYGGENFRPHYHLILFGVQLCAEDMKLVEDSWTVCDWDSVRHGAFGLAEPESIEYVAGYINNFLNGGLKINEYDCELRQPVFKISSNGIGKKWCEENMEQINDNGYVSFGVYRCSIPRYYLDRCGAKVHQSKEKEKKVVKAFTGLHDVTEDELYNDFIVDSIKYQGLKIKNFKQRERVMDARDNIYKRGDKF